MSFSGRFLQRILTLCLSGCVEWERAFLPEGPLKREAYWPLCVFYRVSWPCILSSRLSLYIDTCPGQFCRYPFGFFSQEARLHNDANDFSSPVSKVALPRRVEYFVDCVKREPGVMIQKEFTLQPPGSNVASPSKIHDEICKFFVDFTLGAMMRPPSLLSEAFFSLFKITFRPFSQGWDDLFHSAGKSILHRQFSHSTQSIFSSHLHPFSLFLSTSELKRCLWITHMMSCVCLPLPVASSQCWPCKWSRKDELSSVRDGVKTFLKFTRLDGSSGGAGLFQVEQWGTLVASPIRCRGVPYCLICTVNILNRIS